MAEVRVCHVEELQPGVVKSALVGNDMQGLPVVALALRDNNGDIQVYRNLCRHLPVPLDGGTGELMHADGAHLLCGTHGATYRLHDGYCVEGPCKGLSLHALPWEERDGALYVRY